MKRLFAKLFVAVTMIAFVSCESEEVLPKAYNDTFIIAKIAGDVNVYGLGFYTYANVPMSSVVAESESGDTYQLKPFGGSTYEYYLETSSGEFTTSIPEIGEYTYTVVPTKGDVLVDSDILSGDVLNPVSFTKCEFNTTYNRIEVAWELSEDADYGVLVLQNADGNAVYYSSTIASSTSSAYITTSNWSNGYTPVDGVTYTVELHLFLTEGSASSFLESKAITTQDIVWGEDTTGE